MKRISNATVLRRLQALALLGMVGGSSAIEAAPDPCALIKPEEISKLFGDTFTAPERVATAAGPLAGPSFHCTFKGQNLEVIIESYDGRSVSASAQSWEVRRKRDLAKKSRVDAPGIGDSGYFFSNLLLESHQGIHDYNFSVAETSATAHKDFRAPLSALGKLFYSRVQ